MKPLNLWKFNGFIDKLMDWRKDQPQNFVKAPSFENGVNGLNEINRFCDKFWLNSRRRSATIFSLKPQNMIKQILTRIVNSLRYKVNVCLS